jgi:aryl-alcohol dehydrogenase-like predicted oxidoreductase
MVSISGADRKVIEAVAAIAQARGVPAAQVALAWVLSKQEVTAPIAGASRAGHLDDALAAVEFQLTDTDARLHHSGR